MRENPPRRGRMFVHNIFESGVVLRREILKLYSFRGEFREGVDLPATGEEPPQPHSRLQAVPHKGKSVPKGWFHPSVGDNTVSLGIVLSRPSPTEGC